MPITPIEYLADVFTVKLPKSTQSIQRIVIPCIIVVLYKGDSYTLQTSEIFTDVLTSFHLIRPFLLCLIKEDNIRKCIFML